MPREYAMPVAAILRLNQLLRLRLRRWPFLVDGGSAPRFCMLLNTPAYSRSYASGCGSSFLLFARPYRRVRVNGPVAIAGTSHVIRPFRAVLGRTPTQIRAEWSGLTQAAPGL